MKIKLQGFVITDVAHEYYAILGKKKSRLKCQKSFFNLKKIDRYVLFKALKNIYERQIALLKCDEEKTKNTS